MNQRKRRRGSGVTHDRRDDMEGWVHVCIKLQRWLPSLRKPAEYELLLERFRLVKERFGCSLRQFSVQEDHIHLLIETRNTSDLSRYMQGLQIRFARALNKLWKRTGKVFADRFFAKLCDDWRAIRAVTRYILNTALRHGVRNWRDNEADPYSSGPWYIRWRSFLWSRFEDPEARWPVVHPRCSPYEFYAPIWPDDVPGHAVRARYANT